MERTAAALRVRSIDFDDSEMELSAIFDVGDGPAASVGAVPDVIVAELLRTGAGADVDGAVEEDDDVDEEEDVEGFDLCAMVAERIILSDLRGQEGSSA